MTKSVNLSKYFLLLLLSSLLTVLTLLLGAPFLRALHKAYGSILYWLPGLFFAGLFLSLQAMPLSIFVLSIWMTVGVYGEIEKRGGGWSLACWISLGLGTGIFLGGFAYQMHGSGIDSWDKYFLLFTELTKKIEAIAPNMKIDPVMIGKIIPAAVVHLLILALAQALILEKKILSWLELSYYNVASQMRLLEFKTQDYFVWMSLIASFVSLINFNLGWLESIGHNVLIIAATVYFFQALAIIESYLRFVKAGVGMRLSTYILISFMVFGNLFLLLSVVGLIDYWLDFRGRFRRVKTAELN